MPDDAGAVSFSYSNLSGRPPGRLVSLLARFLSGVREVQEHVEPYARAWEERNAENVRRVAAGARWWAVLGDSMSQGIGASAPDRGWVGQLQDDVPLPRVNFSFNGARIVDVLDRQLPALEDLAVACRNKPALVTLMIGSNDMNSRRGRGEISTAMADLLHRVPRGTLVTTQPGAQGAALMVNHAIDDAAAAGRIRIAEFRVPDMRTWKGRLAADRFHPNDAGYAAMADIVRHALRAPAV
ncbi:SGNH/GDSL hydrolase family protein [Aeromicrobium sp. CTD01-1L150]|uniref:SGNH/GDSL hydrolase family protein n=1 Tax=Aeromicrobium sp. CTD01-1L150 TaxID=3341830 RepID=UPI0035C08CA8